MDEKGQLYALMGVAQEQQQAVTAIMAALQIQQAELARTVAKAGVAVGDMSSAGIAAARLIEAAAEDAARRGVGAALADVSVLAVQSMENAAKPILGRFSTVASDAERAERTLHGAMAWFTWRWAALCAVIAGGTLSMLFVLATLLVPTYEEIGQLRAERNALQAGIEQLEKRGARIKMTTCGKRLCVEASDNQGPKNPNWTGPWNTDSGVPLVIPKGY